MRWGEGGWSGRGGERVRAQGVYVEGGNRRGSWREGGGGKNAELFIVYE